MGYMENSYSNSNNGGSVNSQDSLWQMKMQSAASNANSVTNDHAPRITDQVNHYGMHFFFYCRMKWGKGGNAAGDLECLLRQVCWGCLCSEGLICFD